jgi:hypothetical protein
MRTILITLFLLNTAWSSIRAQSGELAGIAVEGANLFSGEIASLYLPETGAFITATDICTLRLHEKFAGWKEHVVISQTDVSLWDYAYDIMVGRPGNEWEKQAKNNEDLH